MIEGQGLFQLAARSAAYSALSSNKAALHGHVRNAFEKSNQPSPLAHLTVDANTTIRAMFQAAWEKVHADDNLISDDMLKRLEKASKSDNKEIAAERLRQAKAKLRSLRLQAQIAAASGDAKALKRIAQQAAQAAREVAGAARGLAEGIASSATADTSASGSVPLGAAGNTDQTQGQTSTATATPTEGDSLAMGRDALRQLGDETRAAIAQAKGLIAFAAQAARMRRNHRPDPAEDSDYRALQQSVNESGQELESTLNAAWQSLQSGVDAPGDPGGDAGGNPGIVDSDSISVTTTTAVFVQVTTEFTLTASVVV
jgi:hypothetical protein